MRVFEWTIVMDDTTNANWSVATQILKRSFLHYSHDYKSIPYTQSREFPVLLCFEQVKCMTVCQLCAAVVAVVAVVADTKLAVFTALHVSAIIADWVGEHHAPVVTISLKRKWKRTRAVRRCAPLHSLLNFSIQQLFRLRIFRGNPHKNTIKSRAVRRCAPLHSLRNSIALIRTASKVFLKHHYQKTMTWFYYKHHNFL